MVTLSHSAHFTPLLEDVGDRPVVMLGEASHGTHEYYTLRAALSKRLIREKDFRFIAVEGDWPDCYKINRYIKGYPDGGASALEVLKTFDRWPTWMWANWEMVAFTEWLKEYNTSLPMEKKVGFYGLDVYSLWDSMKDIMEYMEKIDPEGAKSVQNAIRCFEPYEEEGQLYAHASVSDSCRDEVLKMLTEVRKKVQYGDGDREDMFSAEQNALIAVNAEKYYRSMMSFSNESWNVRDTHMMETLDRLMQFYGQRAKGIVWEHNTHIGDARATDMKSAGMINMGQLAREQYGVKKVYLVGFGSYAGSVIAAKGWGAAMEKMKVPPAREGSLEEQMHAENKENRYFLFSKKEIQQRFQGSLKHRAIGVVYYPDREKYGNYVSTILPQRYDAFIYLDETRALHPLHLQPQSQKIPDTYPFGF